MKTIFIILTLTLPCLFLPLKAQDLQVIVFKNVKVFDGYSPRLSEPVNVWVRGSKITAVSSDPVPSSEGIQIIEGNGRILMPGLIDVHVHLVFGALTMQELTSPDLNEQIIMQKAMESAGKTLMRGFTSVRDAGGPIFPLKRAIDSNKAPGPRIWPSGATISQTGGHGDFRTPDERSRKFFGQPSRAEVYGATFIADGRAEVLTAVRENLRFGASQIKVMAGGGISSAYDPIDVTQYTLDEMKAAVEAAEDWGTYVTVHAYTPRAVRRAIEAGVKCIEHGQLLDEETLILMADRGIWLSLQNLLEDSPEMDQARRDKRKPVIEGQAKIWPMAKEQKVKLAWGTDFLFEPALNDEQNAYILKLKPWFTNGEILKMITHDNAELLQMSGLRSPYPGKLGVIEPDALADLLLVDGNPLESLEVLSDPENNFLVIMKDGQIVKNITDN